MSPKRENRLIIEIPRINISEPSDILKIAQHVKNNQNSEILIVITGYGNITDEIASLAYESSHNQIGFPELDELLALGQLLGAQLITTSLKSQKIKATYIDPFRDNPISTIGNSGNPQISEIKTIQEVKRLIDSKLSNNIIILCGLIGRNENGKITIIRENPANILRILKKALNTRLHLSMH
ncbi:MAG: amino acid kinase family protein [Candidatus Freyarchaeota archaeon]